MAKPRIQPFKPKGDYVWCRKCSGSAGGKLLLVVVLLLGTALLLALFAREWGTLDSLDAPRGYMDKIKIVLTHIQVLFCCKHTRCVNGAVTVIPPGPWSKSVDSESYDVPMPACNRTQEPTTVTSLLL